MSAYTLGEIVVWLLLAAALGFVLGWLVRGQRDVPTTLVEPVEPVIPTPPAAPTKRAPKKAARATKQPAVRPVAGPFPRSALPVADGAAPSAAFTVKGNSRSMICHLPGSRSYARTVADVWFRSEADAVAAGFRTPRTP